ncbi:MAG TPA: hypothetical protein ENI11_05090 [Actinobacteria bacterium]|nr:hypothetical protein [Actinomycetota bacterium]
MKRIPALIIVTLLLLLSLSLAADATYIYQGLKSPRVIMIVVNGISVEDLVANNLPNIKKSLEKNAAIGLMNTRGAKGTAGSASSYLTIGTGARSKAGKFGDLAVDKGEKVQFHGKLQSFPITGRSQVASPSYPEMSRLSGKLGYTAVPGTLGELLRKAGIKRAVFGNADALGKYHREINLIIMDTRGSTDYGSVARAMNTPDQAIAAIKKGLLKSQFVALEYGDTAKVGSWRDFRTNQKVDAERKRSLREIDSLFGKLSATFMDDDTMIIMVSPFPPVELAKSSLFQAPIIISSRNHRGLLTSASTRWKGMLTNTDIAPTILSFLDVSVPANLRGRSITSIPDDDPLAVVERLEKKSSINYTARSQIIRAYITVVVVALIVISLAFLLSPRGRKLVYFQPILLSLIFFPAVALLGNIPDLPAILLPVVIPLVSLAAGFATWLIWRHNPVVALAVPCLIGLATLIIQLPLGSILERNSILGMNSIIGARFYGIGNEYTGVMLACAVLCAAAWFTIRGDISKTAMSLISSGLFLILTIIIGWPSLGANVGGALSAIGVGIIFTLLLQKTRLTGKHVFLILGGMVVAASILLVADLLSSSSSHAARAASLIGKSGPGPAVEIISRKLATNVRLISYSSWTNILLASAFSFVSLKLGAAQFINRVAENYDLLVIGLKSMALGSIVALLLNDSGVVSAAIMVLYASCSWLYLVLYSNEAPASV